MCRHTLELSANLLTSRSRSRAQPLLPMQIKGLGIAAGCDHHGWLLLILDSQDAHRTFAHRYEDRGALACSTGRDEFWVNNVGTFGVASASYSWDSLAALTQRLLLRLLETLPLWTFLFADDTLHLIARTLFTEIATLCLAIRLAFGDPLALNKVQLGPRAGWIGFRLSLKNNTSPGVPNCATSVRVGLNEIRSRVWVPRSTHTFQGGHGAGME